MGLGSPDERKRAGYLEGLISIIVNTVLFVVKFAYGVLYNSIALIADSVHTLSDSLTSVVVILGFWISYKPADKEHPFGHGRAEQIASIAIGSMLFMVGLEMLGRSYEKLVSGEGLEFGWELIVVLVISTIAKEALARWSASLGEKYNAKSLILDAWHHRSDALVTLLLALGILFGREYWWVDGLLGMGVSGVILLFSVKMVIDVGRELLGTEPTAEEREKLIRIARGVSGEISSVHDIRVHKYGDHVEATLHIKLPSGMPLSEAHRIATAVEEAIERQMQWKATVHAEPEEDEEE